MRCRYGYLTHPSYTGRRKQRSLCVTALAFQMAEPVSANISNLTPSHIQGVINRSNHISTGDRTQHYKQLCYKKKHNKIWFPVQKCGKIFCLPITFLQHSC